MAVDCSLRLLLCSCSFLLLTVTRVGTVILPDTYEQPCDGTRLGAILVENHSSTYEFYMKRYTNCTHVTRDNLEIVGLRSNDYDMSFLENIRVVEGRIFIYKNLVSRIALPSLRVIRGLSFYRLQVPSSLYVVDNSNETSVGLTHLGLPALTDILAGDVRFENNSDLCIDGLVNWSYITRQAVETNGVTVVIRNNGARRDCSAEVECDEFCDVAGHRRYCWGNGRDQCQKVGVNCTTGTCNGRCADVNVSQCCHDQCVGGCSGPRDTDCWSCRNYRHGNSCVESCPKLTDMKSRLCVDRCSDRNLTMTDEKKCVPPSECGPNKTEKAGVCVDIKEDNVCNGVDYRDYFNEKHYEEFVTKKCRFVKGAIIIANGTFERLTTADLEEALINVEIIDNYLVVLNAVNADFTSLKMLRNLREIRGLEGFRINKPEQCALGVDRTSLTSLGLVSLKTIGRGYVAINGNRKLCLADTIDWKRIIGGDSKNCYIGSNGQDAVCGKCSERCSEFSGCWGPTDDQCFACATEYKTREDTNHCVKACSDKIELAEDEKQNDQLSLVYDDGLYCKLCDSQCAIGCNGSTADNCTECRNAKYNGRCVEKCPDGHIISSDRTCVNVMIWAVAVTLAVVIIAVTFAFVLLRIKPKCGTSGRSGPEEPLTAKPDMSCLVLIKKSELHLGKVIGSGAFGTVNKGKFTPHDQKVKVHVAIKTLQSRSGQSQADLLNEARIMATVNHPCCIRLFGVCLTEQLMLVTPLMLHGSLIDYLRKNRSSIGCQLLLNWARQIALGMEHLESVGIVHRDLAARNVLVQSCQQVKITDFGLAKLLGTNEQSVMSTGVKLPIKWLALESIRKGVFTHKSDVWSYGVTLWELFTFGEAPYKDVDSIHMLSALEKGERLVQPAICTIDVYMIMIKCWLVDAQNRPTFTELANEFAEMTREPRRFVSIEGERNTLLSTIIPDQFIDEFGDADDAISADDYLSAYNARNLLVTSATNNYISILPESRFPSMDLRKISASNTDVAETGGQSRNLNDDLDQEIPSPYYEMTNGVPCVTGLKDSTSDVAVGEHNDGTRPSPDEDALGYKDTEYLKPSTYLANNSVPNYLQIVDADAARRSGNITVKHGGVLRDNTNAVSNPIYVHR